jgi:hypothetical protein
MKVKSLDPESAGITNDANISNIPIYHSNLKLLSIILLIDSVMCLIYSCIASEIFLISLSGLFFIYSIFACCSIYKNNCCSMKCIYITSIIIIVISLMLESFILYLAIMLGMHYYYYYYFWFLRYLGTFFFSAILITLLVAITINSRRILNETQNKNLTI